MITEIAATEPTKTEMNLRRFQRTARASTGSMRGREDEGEMPSEISVELLVKGEIQKLSVRSGDKKAMTARI